ncbi:MAG: adenylyltransferase/cytidyltransferase family protein [Patescibacteria group bacterium]
MKTVLAFGTFDVLHLGHLSYLRQAKRLGDRLVVVVARDASVLKGKGKKPFFSERERKEMLSSLSLIDEVLLGDTRDHFVVFAKVQPDVVCLGYDHVLSAKALKNILKERGMQAVRICRAKAYKPQQYKSHLIKKMA